MAFLLSTRTPSSVPTRLPFRRPPADLPAGRRAGGVVSLTGQACHELAHGVGGDAAGLADLHRLECLGLQQLEHTQANSESRDIPWGDVDVAVPNEVEARAVLARLGYPTGHTSDQLATEFAEATGVETVVVTLRHCGVSTHGQELADRRPAPSIDEIVDTTAARDVFVASLAHTLAGGSGLPGAVDHAQLVAASMTRIRGSYEAVATIGGLQSKP